MESEIYSGYYYNGLVFEGQSAMPFILDKDPRCWPCNIKMEPPCDKPPLFPDQNGGVINYRYEVIGKVYNEYGNLEDFCLAHYIWPFKRIK